MPSVVVWPRVDHSQAVGPFTATFDVARNAQGVDCTTQTCFLAAAEAVDFEGTYVVEPIDFAPTVGLEILGPASALARADALGQSGAGP